MYKITESSCGQVYSLLPHPLWVFAPQTTSQKSLLTSLFKIAASYQPHWALIFLFHISSNYCLHLIFYAGVCTQYGFSLVCLYVTLLTVAARLLSMGFPGKITAQGCHAPPKGIFLTRGLNLHHPVSPARPILYPLSHLGSVIFCKHLCIFYLLITFLIFVLNESRIYDYLDTQSTFCD